MLRESFHPDLLRDALDRDRFFDHLWVEATKRPGLVAAFPAERDDLLRGDIPALKARGRGRGPSGVAMGTRIACDFQEPAMAAVRPAAPPDERRGPHTAALGHPCFARDALSELKVRTTRPGSRPVRPETEAGGDGFLAAARAIGDRLDSVALRR